MNWPTSNRMFHIWVLQLALGRPQGSPDAVPWRNRSTMLERAMEPAAAKIEKECCCFFLLFRSLDSRPFCFSLMFFPFLMFMCFFCFLYVLLSVFLAVSQSVVFLSFFRSFFLCPNKSACRPKETPRVLQIRSLLNLRAQHQTQHSTTERVEFGELDVQLQCGSKLKPPSASRNATCVKSITEWKSFGEIQAI